MVKYIDGKLLFRPGGHGALIENLNQLDADIIFVKNIDNVILHNNDTIALYKKALAGILIELQQQIFSFLNLMTKGFVCRQFFELEVDKFVNND